MERAELRMRGVTDPRTLSRLRIERNAWTPILRMLPEDVFITIFFILQITLDDLDNESVSAQFTGNLDGLFGEILSDCYGPWDWTVVTGVCHYWRHISINCSKLWTKINSGWHTKVDRTRAYLTRSKALDLSIKHFAPRDMTIARSKVYNSCLIAVLKEMPRIRDLRFAMASEHHLQHIQNLLTQPASKLECLHITWVDDMKDTMMCILCLDSLFMGTAPRLQHLVLDASYFDWTSPLLKNLKTFNIRSTVYPLTLTDLFTIIGNCPEMEDLAIQHCEVVDNPDSLLKTVALRKLINLDLDGIKGDICKRVLKHLTLPDALLQWSININDLPSPDESLVIPAIIDRENPCNHFFLFFFPQSIGIQEHVSAEDKAKCYRNASVSLTWEDFSSAKGTFKLAANLIRDKFWRHATVLDIHISKSIDWITAIYPEDKRVNDECWSMVLRAVPNLEVLNVQFTFDPLGRVTPIESMLFLHALIALTTALTSRGGEDRSYACPRLSKLKIKSFLFKNTEDIRAFPELNRFLDIRKNAGIPIRNLEIVDEFDREYEAFKAMKKHSLIGEDWIGVFDI